MCNYLIYFFKSSAEDISIKNKSFFKDLLKGFKLKIGPIGPIFPMVKII